MQGGEAADRVVGPFINTLPLRISIGQNSVEASVRHTQGLLAQLLQHEHASLALAQRCSAVPAPLPLFTALLNYRHTAGAAQLPSSETLQAWGDVEFLFGEERTNYPITLSIDDFGDGFRLTAQTQASIEPGRICAFMHTALLALVDALANTPEAPVSSLDVLEAAY